ncbi:unnamed protein product [Adineta steineri]|uniref:Methyltransferase type 11 domain-containing protein n=1 Tax=Adineta steineri TaxID=433720 RepID=A0A816DDD9_9BILA|nr:unnamed protein product [Adineta steineri]CAF1633271.1 unnamed protein product [Adineta steineri]
MVLSQSDISKNQVIIIMDHLPFKSNGKLDKAALPEPNLSSLLLSINNDETSNDQENEILMTNEHQLVHVLWCDMLQFVVNSKIPINRSFFLLDVKGQHDVVIIKDAFVDITYLGTRLHHYDCLLEGKVCLSNLFYKNSNNYIQKIIGQLISNSSSVLNQCQSDELTVVYGSVLIQQIFKQNSITLQDAGAAWCVHSHVSHSYIGIDYSQDIINLYQRLYSTTPRLSFVVADATKHLPFENESIDIILCIETTHAFDEPIAITQFVNEVVCILRPNGYLLWCDFCYMNGSGTSVYDLIENDELIIEEKINITRNVLHARDIQNKSRTDFIQRYIQPEEQEYFRLFAGLPGTQFMRI